ncbi:MAG: WbqC family protein [Bacteroidetes bacterium]|nr:WbqC family protein [Bacteroidota bacterium]
MNLIIDLQYFATINLYEISNKFLHIVFEQCEYYQKTSFRNRCQIAGADGVINLSIPLEKGRDQKTLMKDVRIADTLPWQAQHWKTIVSCYNRSPWFEHYRDDLEGLYKTRYDFLVDWNLACFEWTVKVLRMPVQVSLTKEYRKVYAPGEGEDWRNKFLPKNREMDGPRYRQVFEERTGFISGLSILDLLFCEGRNASGHLRREAAAD